MTHISRSFVLVPALVAGCLLPATRLSAQSAKGSLPEALQKAIAHYATLASYADTGTVTLDTGGTVDKSRFTTYYRRASRDFFFDFQMLSSTTVSTKFTIDMSAHRFVLWMFKGSMQSYQRSTLKPHQIVNPDNQVQALSGLAHPTRGAAILITSLLYSQARLPSAIFQIETAALAGVEDIGGRRCHKVVGTAAAYYPSGQRTGVRPVTVWIDTETQLIRRVLEDTPQGYGDGKGVLRITFDYQPQANPAIDDGKFQFSVPTK